MTERHLKELETRLEQARWHVTEKVDRADYQDPAYWTVSRPDGSDTFRLSFPAHPDLDEQTVRDAFTAESSSGPSVYFARGSSWADELETFMRALSVEKSPHS